MELILLEKVRGLGNLGAKVNVKPGYGRNYLLPQGKAAPATAANLESFEKRRAEYEAKANKQLSDATARQATIATIAAPSHNGRRSRCGAITSVSTASRRISVRWGR